MAKSSSITLAQTEDGYQLIDGDGNVTTVNIGENGITASTQSAGSSSSAGSADSTLSSTEQFWQNIISQRGDNGNNADTPQIFQTLRDTYTDVASWIMATGNYQGPIADAVNPIADPLRNADLRVLQYLYQDVDNLALTYQLAQPLVNAASQVFGFITNQTANLLNNVASATEQAGNQASNTDSQPDTSNNALLLNLTAGL